MAITKNVLKNGLEQLRRLYSEGYWPQDGAGWKRLETDWQLGLMGKSDEEFNRAVKFFPSSQQAKYMRAAKPGPGDLLVALDELGERDREQAVSDRTSNRIRLPAAEEKSAQVESHMAVFREFTGEWKSNLSTRDKLWRLFCKRLHINGEHMKFRHTDAFSRISCAEGDREEMIDQYAKEVNG